MSTSEENKLVSNIMEHQSKNIENLVANIEDFKSCLNTAFSDYESDEKLRKSLESLKLSSPEVRTDNKVKELFENFLTDNLTMKFIKDYINHIIDHESDILSTSKNKIVSNFIKVLMILWNVNDVSPELCTKIMSYSLHKDILRLLDLPSLHSLIEKEDCRGVILTNSAVGVIQNILNHYPTSRGELRQNNAVEIIKKCLRIAENSRFLYTSFLIVLVYLVDENENTTLHAEDAKIKYILQILADIVKTDNFYSKTYGYHLDEMLRSLKHLASPEKNKSVLLKNDVLKSIGEVFIKCQEMEKEDQLSSPETKAHIDSIVRYSLELIWSLSFVNKNEELLRKFDEVRKWLDYFNRSSWPVTCRQNIRGILTNIEMNSSHLIQYMGRDRYRKQKNGHVMISYNHKTQPVMLKVKEGLESFGFRTWMDVDHQKGSFVDAMAGSLEGASVVVLGLCQAFKDSPHCRHELRYAYQLNIPMIPLLLEDNFSPDGWLGFLLATIIYIPLVSDDQVPEALSSLKIRIQDFYNEASNVNVSSSGDKMICDTSCEEMKKSDESVTVLPLTKPAVSMSPVLPVSVWGTAAVVHWFQYEQLNFLEDRLQGINGKQLLELARLSKLAPEGILSYYQRDLHLSMLQVLRLNEALSRLV